MNRRWTEAEIWSWYRDHDWISGCNFSPSTSLGGMFALFQEYGHEQIRRDAAKEIALAASVGLNSLRVFLPFEVWHHQHDAFFAHLDEFLALLDSYGMSLMPVIFNDCRPPKSQYHEPVFGPQPEPKPGFFGGTDENSFDTATQTGRRVGYSVFDEPGMEPVAERYVRELAQRYGHDSRILIWNVWNEVGNSSRDRMSLPLMRKAFAWLRDENVDQPLTAEVWGRKCPMTLHITSGLTIRISSVTLTVKVLNCLISSLSIITVTICTLSDSSLCSSPSVGR